MRSITLLRVLVYCCMAVPAGAQSTFANVRAERLPTVYVTDRAGQQTKGQLIGLTESAIIVKTDTLRRTFAPAEVSRIERKGDSLKNGAIIGAAFGGYMGAMTGGLADCPNPNNRSHCPGTHVAMSFLSIGLWAAIGTAIDAAIPGRTRIWPAKSPRTGEPTVSISPQEHRAFVGWRFR